MYGTAGGDIVEHAAPGERSSDTARGSGNPRDTANTSPSTRRNLYRGQKKNCDARSSLDEYLGFVQTSLRTGPCPRKANSELADCHIQTPPLVLALAAMLASRSRKFSRRRFSRSRSHLVRVPTTLAFCNGGRDIKSLLPFRFNGSQEGS